MKDAQLVISVCDNHRLEVEAILRAGEAKRFRLACYPAHCGRPPLTWRELEGIWATSGAAAQIHLLGSCCLASLGDPPQEGGCACTISCLRQCFYLFSTPAHIDHLMAQGAYLATPGWLSDWQRHVAEWGFSRQEAREFFARSAKNITLLDTGVREDGTALAQQFASFVGLPLSIVPVGLEHLALRLQTLELDAANRLLREQGKRQERQAADAMMAISVLSELTGQTANRQAAASVVELFILLFAPTEIKFYPMDDEALAVLRASQEPSMPSFERLLRDGVVCLDSGQGFWLLIKAGGVSYGVIKVAGIAFPEYLEQYVSLALAVANLCGMVMRNAFLAEELKQANKIEAISTFAGGMVHDFNSLLTIILGYTEMALEEMTPESQTCRFLTKVTMAGNQASELLRQILVLSPMPLAKCQPVDVVPVVAQLLSELKRTTPPTISIVSRIASDCGLVVSIPGQMHQVLKNICTNAIQAMAGAGGILRVDMHKISITKENNLIQGVKEGNYLVIIVSDTGPGLAPEIMDRIFDPFFTTREVGEGAGLGLAVARGLVRSMGGGIKAASEQGKGATFSLFFPLVEKAGSE